MDIRYNFERKQFLMEQLETVDDLAALFADIEQATTISRIPHGIPLLIRWKNIELSAYLFEPSGTEGETLLVERMRRKKSVTPELVVKAG